MSSIGLTRRAALAMPSGLLLQRSGYVNWSWDRWKQMTGETAPQITTEQTGRAQFDRFHRFSLGRRQDRFAGAQGSKLGGPVGDPAEDQTRRSSPTRS